MSSIIEKQKIAKGKVYYHQNSIAFEFEVAANGGEKILSFYPFYSVIRSIEMLGPATLIPQDVDFAMNMGTKSFVAGGFGGRGFNDPNNLGSIVLDGDFGDLSEKFEYLADKLYEPGEKFFIKCSQASATSGFQECGLTGKNEESETGLVSDTTYSFGLAVDGGALTNYEFTVGSAAEDTNYGPVVNKINEVLKNAGAGAEFSLVDGDLRCTSAKEGKDSQIALSAGTTQTSLFDGTNGLDGFSAFDAAVDGLDSVYDVAHGYQELGLSEVQLDADTGLIDGNTYYFKVGVDGGSQVELNITLSGDTSFGAVIALMNNALSSQSINAEFTLENGDLRCTSLTLGNESLIQLSGGTSGEDLFENFFTYRNFDPPIQGTSGYRDILLSDSFAQGDSVAGLSADNSYEFKLGIDGGSLAVLNISFGSEEVPTYELLVQKMNDLSVNANFTFMEDRIRCQSESQGDNSSINLAAGNTNDIFSEMTDFLNHNSSYSIGSDGFQECGVSGINGSDSSPLESGRNYAFRLAIDGGPFTEYTFTAQTGDFDSLINDLNSALGSATALFSIQGENIRCTSSTTNPNQSSVNLAPGENEDDLFINLTGITLPSPVQEPSKVRCCMVVDLYNKNSPPLKLGDYAKRKYSTILEKSISVPASGNASVKFDLGKSYRRLNIRQIGFEAGNIGGPTYDPDVIEDVSVSLLHMGTPNLQNFPYSPFTDFQLKHSRKIDFKNHLEISGSQFIEFNAANNHDTKDVNLIVWMEVELFS